MKTEAIRLCIQGQFGKEDYEEARKELNALLERIAQLEAEKVKPHHHKVVCPECETLFTVSFADVQASF
jgi:hypothetical protein